MIILPIFAFISILYFQTNLLISIILFFGLPSIYLSTNNPRAIVKTAIFTFLVSIPLTFIFDYLLVKDNAWYIVTTVFPFRLFDVVTLEQFFFTFLCIYFMISVYEHFFDRKTSFRKDQIISRRMLIFGLISFTAAFTLIGIILINNSTNIIPYAYAFLGMILGVIPVFLFLWHFPNFIWRFIKITVYFFIISLLMEYAGLKLNQWIFPGLHYIWTFKYFGFRIPVEEVMFYFILSTPGLLTYYEYLDDDRK